MRYARLTWITFIIGIFTAFGSTLRADAFILRNRLKRQNEQYQPPPSLSSNYNVLQPSYAGAETGQNGPNPAAVWPFAHQFHNGLDIVPKPIVSTEGHLDIRDVKKLGSVWDMKGNLTGGSNHAWYNYGHLIQPINRYNMTPSEFAAWTQSQEFKDARENSPVVPVATLPGGWTPVQCRPPLCNPYVQTVAAGVDVMPASGGFVQGGLDFPSSQSDNGSSVRFPLSGDLFAGKQPISVQYGQQLNPVPFMGDYHFGKNIKDAQNQSAPTPEQPTVGSASTPQQQQNGQQNDPAGSTELALPPGYSSAGKPQRL